jgi:hypothetical protein
VLAMNGFAVLTWQPYDNEVVYKRIIAIIKVGL